MPVNFSHVNIANKSLTYHPYVKAEYDFAVGGWNVGAQYSMPSISNISMTFNLDSPDQVEFSINGDEPEALLIREMYDDLWVRRDGEMLFRGPVVTGTDSPTSTTYGVHFTALDYREVLDWHLLYVPDTEPHTVLVDTPIQQVVWDLIDHANNQPGMGVHFNKGRWPTTGPGLVADFPWEDGLPLYTTIQEKLKVLADGQSPGEFWIEAGPTPQDITAHLEYPSRGTDRGVTLDYKGAVSSFTRTFDRDKFANQIRQSGADYSRHFTLPVDSSGRPTVANPEQGLRGKAMRCVAPTVTSVVNDDASIKALAEYNLRRYSAYFPAYSGVQLAPGFWRGKDHIWLGDTVRILCKRGRINVTESDLMRVHGITISLDSSMNESVSLTLNWPDDPTNDLRKFASTVLMLNRR